MAQALPAEPKMSVEDAKDHASKMLPDANGMLYGSYAADKEKWGIGRVLRESKPKGRRRVGWTTKPDGYKVLCCGNSLTDILLIILCFIILYGVIALLFFAFLQLIDLNMEVVLAVFGCIGLAFIICLGIFVMVGQKQNEKIRMSEKWKARGGDNDKTE